MKHYLAFLLLLINFIVASQVPDLIPYRKGTRWGYVNTKKEFVTPVKFISAGLLLNGSAIAQDSADNRLIDINGRTIATYDSIIRVIDYPNLLVLSKGKWGLIDPKGRVIIAPTYSDIHPDAHPEYNPFMTITEKNMLKGCLDIRSGAVYISPPGCGIYAYQHGYADVTKGNKAGVMDSTGRLIVPVKFDEVRPRGNNLFATVKIKKIKSQFISYKFDEVRLYGLYNKQGVQILETEYHYISEFKEGLAVVCKDHNFRYIDTNGKFVLGLEYKNAGVFSEGIAHYHDEMNSTYSFMNKKGEPIFKINAEEVDSFSCGLCMFGRRTGNGPVLYGYVNRKGEEVIAPQFDRACVFSQGRAMAQTGRAWFIIDTTGKPINDDIYDELVLSVRGKPLPSCFSAGKIRLIKAAPGGGRKFMGMVNLKGEVIAPFIYDEIEIRGNQLKATFWDLKGNYLYAWVDSASGKPITELKYMWTDVFSDGMAGVAIGKNGWIDYCGFINTKGEEAVELKYKEVRKFSEGLAPVRIADNLWGFVDKTGKLVIDFKYKVPYEWNTSYIVEGLIKVYKNEKLGYIDKKGNEYFED